MSHRRNDRKATRKTEALARNAAWKALPLVTKVDRLNARPGLSRRQFTRLQAGER